MDEVLLVLDNSPTLYVLGVAWLVYLLGNNLRRRKPELAVWQDASGAGTFLLLALWRLIWQPPTMAGDAILVLLRAAAFGVIAFGISGTLGIVSLTVSSSIEQLLRAVRERINAWRRVRDQRRRDANTPRSPRVPTTSELEQEQVQREEREQQAQKREEDRQRRLDLRLQAELEMEFAADHERRKTLSEFIETYADESLPVEVYEQRLATIRDAAARYAPVRAKKFQSMQEIINDFEHQLADVEDSTQSEFEKESLRSLILMERQNAIQRFIQS